MDETDNYERAESAPAAFVISQADITIIADNLPSKYKEKTRPLTYQVGGKYVAGDDLHIRLRTDASSTAKAGQYPVVISWSNPNYKAVVRNGVYTIRKADLTVTTSGYSGTYDGNSRRITVNTGSSDAVVYYSTGTALNSSNFNKAGSASNPQFTKAGTYTVYYYVYTGNYDPHPVQGSQAVMPGRRAAHIHGSDSSVDRCRGEAKKCGPGRRQDSQKDLRRQE